MIARDAPVAALLSAASAGDRAALARLITHIERNGAEARELAAITAGGFGKASGELPQRRQHRLVGGLQTATEAGLQRTEPPHQAFCAEQQGGHVLACAEAVLEAGRRPAQARRSHLGQAAGRAGAQLGQHGGDASEDLPDPPVGQAGGD